ncbi:GLPGLI family protein [Portibacter lacus]|uniref:GLPGLI family protein n=1 Tax=Portibacter lacus TaxID=1099794 RepID=A0AA37SP66_9BACT|nr:GLPGLI family protein [Portibacter lacus]GLR17119.1 GLPGLI family protein [Portibacter lacus]
MKQIITVFLVVIIAFSANAQKKSGTIEFDRKQDWIQIMSKLPYMTQEEIDRSRLTWGKNEGNGQPFILYFNENESLYTYKEEVSDYGYSWKKDDYVVIRDYENKTIYDKIDFLGRTYILQEDAPRIKWKILNEIKEVAGYLCMKAETVDTVKGTKIHAWFSDEIPVYAGPEGFYGLPGMILGLDFNDGDVIVEATKVTFSDEVVELPIPKKMKGRKLTVAEMNTKAKKYIEESIEGRKNPYWQMRY